MHLRSFAIRDNWAFRINYDHLSRTGKSMAAFEFYMHPGLEGKMDLRVIWKFIIWTVSQVIACYTLGTTSLSLSHSFSDIRNLISWFCPLSEWDCELAMWGNGSRRRQCESSGRCRTNTDAFIRPRGSSCHIISFAPSRSSNWCQGRLSTAVRFSTLVIGFGVFEMIFVGFNDPNLTGSLHVMASPSVIFTAMYICSFWAFAMPSDRKIVPCDHRT